MSKSAIFKIISKNLENALVRMISALLMSSMLVLSTNQDFYTEIYALDEFPNDKFVFSFVMMFLAFTFVYYTMLSTKLKYLTDAIILAGVSFMYGVLISMNTHNVYYICVTAFFVILAFRYALEKAGGQLKGLELPAKTTKAILVIFGIATLCYLGMLLVLRIYVFKPVTFDFGIFVQMFYYMKKCFIPYTTCERYELLSHFTVHFSPFFYLLLPFYVVFPSPYTLVIVQLLAVLSGVIPLYLMCRKQRMSNLLTLAVCVAYLSYPCLRGGLFYDFHENKFLSPLVLWLLYFFDLKGFSKKKLWGITIFSMLVLSIKEDAAIYTACIGLFQAVYKKDSKDKIAGAVLMAVSVVYFFVVFHFMSIHGDAGSAITSFGRYENLMGGSYNGVSGIVANMLKNPAYVMSQLLSGSKLEFLVWMFVPLAFLPFFTKRMSTYLLMVPMVVLNLLSNYGYQHNIYYQYTYASGVLLVYLAMLGLGQMKGIQAKKAAIYLIVLSILCGTASISDRTVYFDDYRKYHTSIDNVRELLNSIPKDASVCATTTYVPVLAQRDEIYKYQEGDTPDYLVFSLAGSEGEKYEKLAEEYLENGYRLFGKIEEKVVVLEKNNLTFIKK